MYSKRTKIVATIGPASTKMEDILAMIKTGMDVARVNFSHGTQQENGKMIQTVRGAAKALGKPIAVIQDLQGPRVRASRVQTGGLELKEGERVTITTAAIPRAQREKQEENKIFGVTHKGLNQDLKRDRIILIDDGLIKLKVLSIRGQNIQCRVLIGGILTQGRGMNFPGTTLSLPAITSKDRRDLEYGIKSGIDYVALSFMQSAQDIIALKRLIKIYEDRESPRTQMIAKIEKEGALENFDEILTEADAIMIARGDLGIEIDPTRLPLIQKEIISKCLGAAKPVIVATQMLDSMQKNRYPTRAEISDVANAVTDHTDAVMLSQETATGKYPVESVKMMATTCRKTEASPYDDLFYSHTVPQKLSLVSAMSRSACILARDIKAQAILVTTRSGFSARSLVSHRPEVKTIAAVTNNFSVYRSLSLSWGVTPYLIRDFRDGQELIKKSIKILKEEERLKSQDKVVVMTGFKERGDGWSSSLRIIEI